MADKHDTRSYRNGVSRVVAKPGRFAQRHAVEIEAMGGAIALPQKYSRPTIQSFRSCDGRSFWLFAEVPQPKIGETSYLSNRPYLVRLGHSFRNQLLRQPTMPEAAYRQRMNLNISRSHRPHVTPSSFRTQSVFVTPDQPNLMFFRTTSGDICIGLPYRAGQVNQALAAAGFPHWQEGPAAFAKYAERFVRYYWDRELPEGIHPRDDVSNSASALLTFSLVRSDAAEPRLVRQAHLLRRKSLLPNPALAPEEPPLAQLPGAGVYLEQAATLLESNLFDQAEAAARLALEVSPRCSEAYVALANISATRGDIAAAITHQQQAVAIAPDDPKTWFALANLAQRANKLDLAVSALHEADRLETSAAPVQILLADVLIRQGKHNAAIPLLRELSKKPEADGKSYLLLGQALFAAGQLAEAECWLRTAAAMEPEADFSHSLLAETLYRLGRRDEALVILQERIGQQTSDAHIHYLFGHIAVQDGNLIDAETALRTAVALRPNVDGYKGRLAEVMNRQGRRDEALTILSELVAGHTSDAHIHYLLGNTQIQFGNLDDAERALLKAIELQPEVDGYKAALADVFSRRGKREEAVAVLRAVVEKSSGDPKLHAGLGNLLAQGNDLSGAESAFRAAIALEPSADSYQTSLAELLRRQGKHAEALSILTELSKTPTKDPSIFAGLGTLRAENDDLAGAAAAFRTACEMAPDVLQYHFSLADICERQGDRGTARAIVQKLATRATSDPQVYARLGSLAAAMGDLDEAERALRAAAQLDPAVHAFQGALADVLTAQGNREEALSILQLLVAKSTRDPSIHVRLGKMSISNGNLAEAERAYRTAVELDPSVADFHASLSGWSAESVGGLRFGKFAKCMIQRDFCDAKGAESVGFSHGDFGLVVQPLNDAA